MFKNAKDTYLHDILVIVTKLLQPCCVLCNGLIEKVRTRYLVLGGFVLSRIRDSKYLGNMFSTFNALKTKVLQ